MTVHIAFFIGLCLFILFVSLMHYEDKKWEKEYMEEYYRLQDKANKGWK